MGALGSGGKGGLISRIAPLSGAFRCKRREMRKGEDVKKSFIFRGYSVASTWWLNPAGRDGTDPSLGLIPGEPASGGVPLLRSQVGEPIDSCHQQGSAHDVAQGDGNQIVCQPRCGQAVQGSWSYFQGGQ